MNRLGSLFSALPKSRVDVIGGTGVSGLRLRLTDGRSVWAGSTLHDGARELTEPTVSLDPASSALGARVAMQSRALLVQALIERERGGEGGWRVAPIPVAGSSGARLTWHGGADAATAWPGVRWERAWKRVRRSASDLLSQGGSVPVEVRAIPPGHEWTDEELAAWEAAVSVGMPDDVVTNVPQWALARVGSEEAGLLAVTAWHPLLAGMGEVDPEAADSTVTVDEGWSEAAVSLAVSAPAVAGTKQRDHRVIGQTQKLWFFNDVAPGSAFWLPAGQTLYLGLVDFLRRLYRKHGYDEVATPLVYTADLWRQSGHWDHYGQHMFRVVSPRATESDEEAGLKAMNCPGHCVMFGSVPRKEAELPLRIADFSALHRDEPTGTLSGLTRCRRFEQDDAHIFCTVDQVAAEVADTLAFVDTVYRALCLPRSSVSLYLSTRPASSLGTDEMWEAAEGALREALQVHCAAHEGAEWTEDEGEGAFYGPKIDVCIGDRQCGTIQLDFVLPDRFSLNYVDAAGQKATPVMVHRAALGSVQRMIAVLGEVLPGWPLWLAPRPVLVLPVSAEAAAYADKVARQVESETGLRVTVDADSETLSRRLRRSHSMGHAYVLVVGEAEATAGTVAVRRRPAVRIEQSTEASQGGEKEVCTIDEIVREMGVHLQEKEDLLV